MANLLLQLYRWKKLLGKLAISKSLKKARKVLDTGDDEPWVEGALVWILWGMLILISITAVQRFIKVWKQAEVAPVTQARIDLRRERRASRREARTTRRSTRVPLRERVPRRQD